MLKCWDPDLLKRPTSQEVVNSLLELEGLCFFSFSSIGFRCVILTSVIDVSTRSLLTNSAVNNLKRSQLNFSAEKNKSCIIQ
jgi:hypothetical protein